MIDGEMEFGEKFDSPSILDTVQDLQKDLGGMKDCWYSINNDQCGYQFKKTLMAMRVCYTYNGTNSDGTYKKL